MRRAFPALALSFCPTVALAQTSTPVDRGRIDRDLPDPVQSDRRPVEAAPLPAATGRVDADSASAAPIRGIRFEGTKVPAIVGRAAEAFLGQRADRATLTKLVAAMTEAYGRSPVALFTIVVPEQNLSSGTVRVLVAEGFVEAVVLTGEVDGRDLDLVKAYADRLTHEKPTSRRRMERQLSLIRDIPGLKVDAQLQTGTQQGGVRLILKLDWQKPTLSFSVDNRTTRLVRDGQFQATGRLYSALREGDYTEIAVASSADFNNYRYAGLSHSTPIGSNGIRLAGNVGYLETRPEGSVIRGEAKTAGVTFSWPVIRSHTRNLTLSAGLDGIDSDNAALGSLIASERTRAGRLSVGYSRARGRSAASGFVTVSRGFDMFGARVTAPLAETRFTKINARLNADRAIGNRTALRMRISGQWSQDRLPAVERFAVGGPDFGRAFENALISADRGVAGLGELAWRPIAKGRMSQTELYGFADMAKVDVRRRGPFPGADIDMGSAGGGVRIAWNDKARLELEAAHPIDDPYAGYPGGWRFSVGWRLSLRP